MTVGPLVPLRPGPRRPRHAAGPRPARATCRRPAPRRLRVPRARRLGMDRRPGHRRRHQRGEVAPALPVGLRLGRRRPRLRAPRTVWHFLDPFSTLHDLGAGCCAASASRAGRRPTTRSASAGGRRSSASSAFVWLELVLTPGGPSTLFVVLVGYTALTLAMMAQFGRDTGARTARCSRSGSGSSAGSRRRPGRRGRPGPPPAVRERPARARLDASRTSSLDRARRRRRSCSTGCRRRSPASTCSACPALPGKTLLLVGFLGIIVVAALLVTRAVGVAATGAGLLPIAVGLPHRPLPDVPAHRRPAHPRRDLRPVPAGLGPVRDGVLRAVRRVAAAGPRLDGPARGGRRRPHAGRLGRPRRAPSMDAPRGHRRRRDPLRADPARRRDGRPDHAHALVARAGDRGHAADSAPAARSSRRRPPAVDADARG